MNPNPDFLHQRKPMRTALLLSLLVHALLLSLSFGSQGLGLPGLDLPWRERRFEADELRVVLEPAPAPPLASAVAPAWIEPLADRMPTPATKAEPRAATEAMAVVASVPGGGPGNEPSVPNPASSPTPTVMAVERSDVPALVVPAAPLVPTPEIAEAPRATRPEAAVSAPRDADDAMQKQIAQEARERAREQAQLHHAKQEELRQAEQAEAARQAAVRQDVERVEGARMEGERQEAARQEAARQEKARQLAARAEEDAKRDAVRRAMGRQLDEEAARRDAAARAAAGPSSTLPYSWSNARRGRLFGRTDPNSELILYAEAWSRKIELNMTFDMVREAAKERHNHPLVTVALRSDGSVESVTFVVSSGVPAIDEAIRRIVQSQAPYSAFSPALAREFDVIEIRRSWHFDMAVRLF